MRAVSQSVEQIDLALVGKSDPNLVSQSGDMGRGCEGGVFVREDWESGSSTTAGMDALDSIDAHNDMGIAG